MTGALSRFCGIALVAVLAPLALPGAAAAQSVADIAMMKGADRQAKLEAGAKKEGQVMNYTTMLVESGIRPLEASFSKKYPFIKFNALRNNTSAMIQRILAEEKAGKPVADVVVATASHSLVTAGLAQPFDTPEFAAYPKEYVGPGNMWGTSRVTYNVIGFNTKHIAKADMPKSWEDLANPKYKGKMIWGDALESGGPLVILHIKKVLGDKKAGELFDKLAKQEVASSAASGRAITDMVVAGEQTMNISAAGPHVVDSMAAGAAVDFVQFDPVIARSDQIQLLKSAPHPYAAMLLIDFILSEEGQKSQVSTNEMGARPNVMPNAGLEKIIPRLNGKSEIIYMPEEVSAHADELTSIYQKISR
jgi:ABC-type Fe3+ transport system substrate-binding protein